MCIYLCKLVECNYYLVLCLYSIYIRYVFDIVCIVCINMYLICIRYVFDMYSLCIRYVFVCM